MKCFILKKNYLKQGMSSDSSMEIKSIFNNLKSLSQKLL